MSALLCRVLDALLGAALWVCGLLMAVFGLHGRSPPWHRHSPLAVGKLDVVHEGMEEEEQEMRQGLLAPDLASVRELEPCELQEVRPLKLAPLLTTEQPSAVLPGDVGARQQLLWVMRHGHRQDEEDDAWIATTPRPWDPPLSSRGRQQVRRAERRAGAGALDTRPPHL